MGLGILNFFTKVSLFIIIIYKKFENFLSEFYSIFLQSYGGFYAASVLADSKGVINTAVSVAPVTDWRYYGRISFLILKLLIKSSVILVILKL